MSTAIGSPRAMPGHAAGAPAGAHTPADAEIPPLRKAAILLVSLDEPLAAQLLAQLDRPSVEAVTLEMAHLERVSPGEQRAVLEEFSALARKRLRFLFEDVARLDDVTIREAFHEEDAPTWALALAGAPPHVRAKILGALGAAQAVALRGALGRLGPFRLDDSEAAQAELTERFRRLHDHGRLTLPDPDGQEPILV